MMVLLAFSLIKVVRWGWVGVWMLMAVPYMAAVGRNGLPGGGTVGKCSHRTMADEGGVVGKCGKCEVLLQIY